MQITTWAITIVIAVLLCGALLLFLASLKWILDRVFRSFGHLLTAVVSYFPRSRRGHSVKQAMSTTHSLLPTGDPERTIVLRSRSDDLVVKCHLGDEYRMGWYEKRFSFNRPIAGVDSVETMEGSTELSEDERFLVIHDFYQVVILDRSRDRGVCLRNSGSVLGVTIEDSNITIHSRVINEQIINQYPIRVSEADGFLIPIDWPGQVEMLTQPHLGDGANPGTV
jgi:hypothetical protein